MNKKRGIIILLLYSIATFIYVQLTLHLLDGITPLIFTYCCFLLLFYDLFKISDHIKVRYSKLNLLIHSYLLKSFIHTICFCLIVISIDIIILLIFCVPFQLLEIINYFVFLSVNCFILSYAMIIDEFIIKKKIIPIILLVISMLFSFLQFPLSLISFMSYPSSNIAYNNLISVIGVYLCVGYILYLLKEVKKC